jgi:NAD(P)-dependent dehydrogenase (short-subunit alcohol dehydrogenase family)
MKGLAGKIALVTGSSSGIGQAIALRLAQEGMHVAINFRRGAAEAEMTHELLHQFIDEMQAMNVRHVLVQADV